MSGHKHEWIWVKVVKDIIWESQNEKLHGVNIDNKLNFQVPILDTCKKANSKLTALRRYCKFITLEKKKILFKSFVESQFSYCPLV